MKRFYTFALAALVALSAAAFSPQHPVKGSKAVNAQQLPALRAQHHADLKVRGSKDVEARTLRAPARAEAVEGVITNPEGTLKNYSVSGTGFSDSWFGIMYSSGTYPTSVVFADGSLTEFF